MDVLMSYLPAHPGLLPKWMLLISSIAALNSLQNFLSDTFSRKVYARAAAHTGSEKEVRKGGSPGYGITPLTSRTFGVWTFTSAVVRFYAAYRIQDAAIYDIAIWTYVIALAHFLSEAFFFGTASVRTPGLISPLIVATTSLTWMLTQRGYYTS